MSRIVPKLRSGNNKLVLSETLCIDPKEGLEIDLPINAEKNLKIILNFQKQNSLEKKYESIISENSLKINFLNFTNSLGASLTQPIRFYIGGVNFLIRIYGFSNSENNLLLTFSIYEEGGLVVR